MKNIRHETLRSEPIETRFGRVDLDHNGYVTTDLEEVSGGRVKQEDLLSLPDFVDADLFPGVVNRAPEQAASEPEAPKTAAEEAAPYKAIIKEMIESEGPMNSEGYVDMASFQALIAEQNLKIITGGQRKVLQDEVVAEMAAEKTASEGTTDPE